MARSTAPEYSRSRVNLAGRNVRNGSASPEDHLVIENWRASHAHVLNAFQASLRNRARALDITVAQRLKRQVTIYDKLTRRPGFSLSEMQDVAGCRLIFKTIEDLTAFRSDFHDARFSHRLLSRDDRYDYIARPKEDGYRGIHDVYEYHSERESGSPWNKLRIELQYRTIYQHAWATAVEVAGLLTGNDPKFGRATSEYMEFFRCASDIIARSFEGSVGPRPDLTLADIVESFLAVDASIQLTNVFMQYNNVAAGFTSVYGNTILIFNKRAQGREATETRSFKSFAEAVRELGKMERANIREGEAYDLVLVRSDNVGAIRNAFRNYFADTKEFIDYINRGISLAR
jgi:putative GTP pyrophosphokinase